MIIDTQILPILSGFIWGFSVCIHLTITLFGIIWGFNDIRRVFATNTNEITAAAADDSADDDIIDVNITINNSNNNNNNKNIRNITYTIVRPIRGNEDPGLEQNLLSLIRPVQSDATRQHILCLNRQEFELAKRLQTLGTKETTCDDNSSSSSPHITVIFIENDGTGIKKNDKVLKMKKAVKKATGDWIMFVDSNIRLPDKFMKNIERISTMAKTQRIDIITGIPGGIDATNYIGNIEKCIMNTFFARLLTICDIATFQPISGKFMMFSRSFIDNCLDEYLSEAEYYICEDYVFWRKAFNNSVSVHILDIPIYQYIGNPSMKRVFSRFIRWFLIHRKVNTLVFLVEPILFMHIVSGLIGSHFFAMTCASYRWFWFLCGHMSLAFVMDLTLMSSIDHTTGLSCFWSWIVTQIVIPIMWFSSIFSNSITWRGEKIKVGKNGKIC